MKSSRVFSAFSSLFTTRIKRLPITHRCLSSSIDNTQVYALLSQLIRIPSVNPSLAPPSQKDSSNEINIANFIKSWLISNKIEAHIEQVQPNRPNVFAELGAKDGKTLCLCAHMDTVGVQDMTIDPFDPMLKDGKVYGRGSCDMKAGLASVMLAAKSLADGGKHQRKYKKL